MTETIESDEFEEQRLRVALSMAERQGREDGRAEEAARSLLTVLGARGITVSDAVRERILTRKDPELLERWLKNAAVAASIGEVIDELSDRAALYFDVLKQSVNEEARKTLEAKFPEYHSDFAKKYVAQGRAEGRTQGLTEGRAEEAGRNLLAVLRVRGITVPDADRERILAERDIERLKRWLEKAVVASSVAEVLAEPR